MTPAQEFAKGYREFRDRIDRLDKAIRRERRLVKMYAGNTPVPEPAAEAGGERAK